MPFRQRTTPSFTVEIKRTSRKRAHPLLLNSQGAENSLSAKTVFRGLRMPAPSPGTAQKRTPAPVPSAAVPEFNGSNETRPLRILPDLRTSNDETAQHERTAPSVPSAPISPLRRTARPRRLADGPADTIEVSNLSPPQVVPAAATSEDKQASNASVRVRQRRVNRAAARKAKRLGLAELPVPAGQRWKQRRLPPSCW
jgi:hypothetical protein